MKHSITIRPPFDILVKELQMINERDNIVKHWYEQAEKVRTVEDLTEFINEIFSTEDLSYEDCVYATAAIAAASSWCADNKFGLTGFQGSAAALEYWLLWVSPSNEVGIRVINYTDMLYPQCDHKFEKVITKDMFKALQEAAQKKLDNSTTAHPRVIDHWRSIVEGNVPFGYALVDRI